MKRWFGNSAKQIPSLSAKEAADIIRSLNGQVSVITGAGVSTESGIPDYRGPMGRYMQAASKPMTHQEFIGNEHNRKRFWSRGLIGFKSFDTAKPNRAHFALAELERSKKILGLVTQNVDRLHYRAGSHKLVELHGRGDMCECLTCGVQRLRDEYHKILAEENANWLRDMQGKKYTLTADGDAIIEETDLNGFCIPNCDNCSVGIMKPSYVFFGGSVPLDVASAAMDIIKSSRALLLLGTTASTFSCVRLVRAARELGSPVLIVNRGPTRVDELAQSRYDQGSCGEFLQDLLTELVPNLVRETE